MSNAFWIVTLILASGLTAAACLAAPTARLSMRFNTIGAIASLLAAVIVVEQVARTGAFHTIGGVLLVDELSVVMIGAIGVVGFASALASNSFMRTELESGAVPQGERGVRLYFAGLHALMLTMYLTVSVDSLGLLWIGIEATTVVSALLVGFTRTRAALEAAWKYVILCTVGITCALFGVLLTYYAAGIGGSSGSLDWSVLASRADTLDPALMRLAFVFVLVGFGAKAGFAPLHTWMADAYGQAPSPVSGVLSGVLSSCALYGILRFNVLTTAATGSAFSGRLLIAFGVLSVAVAVPFILLARDLKRLFAYSSVEHIGLMAIAFGIGGPIGISAGLLQLLSHAATKTLLFILAGNVRQRFGTRRIGAIRGLVTVQPVLGWLLVVGVLGIIGAPPFGIFVSEIGIVWAGFQAGGWSMAAVIAVVPLLAIVFAAFLRHLIGMSAGASSTEPGEHVTTRTRRTSPGTIVAMAPLIAAMLLFGVHVPGSVQELFDKIAGILQPAAREAASR